MEIFSKGTAVVTVPLFQDRTKAKTVTWQDTWQNRKEDSQRMAGTLGVILYKLKLSP